MRRRDILTLLGGAGAWPLAAKGQQASRLPTVGYLSARSASEDPQLVIAFRRGLGEAGYVEGRNTAIEYRWAEGHNDRLPGLAADLVRRQVNVIAAFAAPSAAAAKAATKTIPIVFQSSADPIEADLVASLAGPRGNLTGVTTLGVELGPKRLELLHELVPQATRMALLVNPTSPLVAEPMARDLEAAARSLGLDLEVAHASTEPEIEEAFAMLAQAHVGAAVISPDPFFASHVEQIAAASVRNRIPTIYQSREFAAAGGLMVYGSDLSDAYRLVGVYIGRILKGEKPADLPVQQATKFELIINLKTAKTLGLTVPLPLLGLAGEVIE
jgi:putative ABC transport system substrate-binding protein